MNSNFIVNNGTSFNNLYGAIDAKYRYPFPLLWQTALLPIIKRGYIPAYVNNFNLLLNTFNVGGNQMTGTTVQLGIQTCMVQASLLRRIISTSPNNPAYNSSKFGIANCKPAHRVIRYITGSNEVNFETHGASTAAVQIQTFRDF